MNSLYVEERELRAHTSLAWDLAHHIYTRQLSGQIVVVTEGPPGLMAAVSKQWRIIMRQVLRERSSTLKSARIMELSEELAYMGRLRFVVGLDAAGDVFFVTRDQLAPAPQACGTLYVTQAVSVVQLKELAAAMLPHALVVIYKT